MDLTTKISLTIKLEGSTLIRESKPEEINYVVRKKDCSWKKNYTGKDAYKIVERGSRIHYPAYPKDASQHLNISAEAYNYFISTECPEWVKPSFWKIMSKKQRLEAHLNRICQSLGGKSFTYEVLDC